MCEYRTETMPVLCHIEMVRANARTYEGRPGMRHVRLKSGSTETVAGKVKEYDRPPLLRLVYFH